MSDALAEPTETAWEQIAEVVARAAKRAEGSSV